MAKEKIEETVEMLAIPVIKDNDCNLVDIEFIKEGHNWYLRIYIDKDNGVTVEDCQNVSEALSDLLDSADPIDHSYILEVSSPGAERLLKSQREYDYFTGRVVDVKLYCSINGKKEYSGVLGGLADGIVTLDTLRGELRFPKEKIASTRLSFSFKGRE